MSLIQELGRKQLGRNQRAMLADLRKDGSFVPHPNEIRVAQALARRGLVVWEGECVRITNHGMVALGSVTALDQAGS